MDRIGVNEWTSLDLYGAIVIEVAPDTIQRAILSNRDSGQSSELAFPRPEQFVGDCRAFQPTQENKDGSRSEFDHISAHPNHDMTKGERKVVLWSNRLVFSLV
jgi:hypothetical protein